MSDKLRVFLGKYKFVLLVVAVGLALLLWPNAPPVAAGGDDVSNISSDLGQTLQAMLGQTEGVGFVQVLLTAKGAVVVCDGAEDAVSRARVMESVAAATGLGYDKISVIKRKDGIK
ncbi:hypothetical protein FACS1894217_06030 [Clostridia bacterium]|nr:hypothetical protein FACS1894217_06030 [Clostridia bacterium]